MPGSRCATITGPRFSCRGTKTSGMHQANERQAARVESHESLSSKDIEIGGHLSSGNPQLQS